MPELLLILIPIAIAAALQPTQTMVVIALLQTPEGLLRSASFVFGMTIFHVAVGTLVALFVSGVEWVIESEGGQFEHVVGLGLVLGGLLLLGFALYLLLAQQEPDASQPRGVQLLQAVAPWKAVIAGFLWLAFDPKDWLFMITTIDLISEADLPAFTSVVTYLLYVGMVQSLLFSLLVLQLTVPHITDVVFGRVWRWLLRHARTIKLLVLSVVGAYMIVIGFTNYLLR